MRLRGNYHKARFTWMWELREKGYRLFAKTYDTFIFIKDGV